MQRASHLDAGILVVDDQRASVQLLAAVLEQAGYTRVRGTSDPFEVIRLVAEMNPDLILLDLHMPGLNGLQVMEQIDQLIPKDAYLPILVLTADTTSLTKERALAAGAHDFLTKPFNRTEVILRSKNLLHTRYLHLALRHQNDILEQRVEERTKALEEANIEIVERLAQVARLRDDETPEHIRRIADYTGKIARELGIAGEELQMLRLAAQVHDLGKSGVSDSILNKPGLLTPREAALMKHHTTLGASVLSNGKTRLVQLAEEIALNHHECWSGDGYPRGLAGEQIPLSARIVAVADVFDALTNDRPYKRGWPVEKAIEEIQKMSGKQLDPTVVEAFLRVMSSAGSRGEKAAA